MSKRIRPNIFASNTSFLLTVRAMNYPQARAVAPSDYFITKKILVMFLFLLLLLAQGTRHLLFCMIGSKKLAPLFHPITSKNRTSRDSLARVFPRLASATCTYFEF